MESHKMEVIDLLPTQSVGVEKDSNSPSNVWWEFEVKTATHVVFDDIEANHTTLRLFYDRDDSPVVSVDKVSVDYVNIEVDFCVLKCVTCDKTLGNKLMGMFKHFENVWWNVRDKYFASRSQHKFLFIVSHPHRCSKQVSVGQWKDRLKWKSQVKIKLQWSWLCLVRCFPCNLSSSTMKMSLRTLNILDVKLK
ncbi:hypothetical protein BgiMline_031198 [Biomphalaria glabrata]|nr:hypothetical protein BgiMline_019445 [Biomphalaria glabrata]